mmetsp:Transcript_37543/g.115963  ORF Transcript_37543/g.115963 Transcript_37543/m.115963 type:complete len:114 (-) Transcript_37543:480-821(-)
MPADAFDLLQRLVVKEPGDRLTAEQALKHPYFADVRDAENEPVAPRAIAPLLPDGTLHAGDSYRDRLDPRFARPALESGVGGPKSPSTWQAVVALAILAAMCFCFTRLRVGLF